MLVLVKILVSGVWNKVNYSKYILSNVVLTLIKAEKKGPSIYI